MAGRIGSGFVAVAGALALALALAAAAPDAASQVAGQVSARDAAASAASRSVVAPAVARHYRLYEAELRSPAPDAARLRTHALAAWKAAEDVYGDSRITGDLATNFAALGPGPGGDGRDLSGEVEPAFGRAVALARFHGDDAAAVEASREVMRADHRLRASAVVGDASVRELQKLQGRVRRLLPGRTTYRGDVLTLRAEAAYASGDAAGARNFARLADTAFGEAEDGLPSPYRNRLRVLDAVLAREAGRDTEAADTLVGLLGRGDVEPGTRRRALRELFRLRAEPGVEAALRAEPGAMDDPGLSVRRTAPDMPDKAVRSGWAVVRYSIEPDGTVGAAEVVDASERLFGEPALAAVRQWTHAPGLSADAREAVEDVVLFTIATRDGRTVPSYRALPGKYR